MADDLQKSIQEALAGRLLQDSYFRQFREALERGAAGLKLEDAHEYALKRGEASSAALLDVIGPGVLPNDRMDPDTAGQAVLPVLERNFNDVQDAANQVQKALDRAAGIGLNGVRADFPKDRAAGLLEKLAESENIEEMQSWLGEPVVNFSAASFDQWVHANADFRYKAGMSPKVIRKGHPGMCAWCSALVGTYDYEAVRYGSDVWRRHKHCKCVVLFSSERGSFRDVHSKINYSAVRDARVAHIRQLSQQQREEAEARKKALTLGDANGSIKLPERLNMAGSQFGKKAGKHAYDYGLDPSTADGRQKFREITIDIFQHKEEVRKGPWRGYNQPVLFYIKGEDVVILKENGDYISTLKGGINNERVKNARRYKI